MRWIASLLLTSTLATSLAAPIARAERPKEQGDDAGAPPEPTAPPPAAPPAPTVPPAPTIVVAPTVAATGNVVVAPPPAPAPPGGPTVITPQGVPIVIRNRAPDAGSIEHRLVTIDGTVLGACMGNCTFQVPPGTYVVQSSETDELRSGRQQIVASGPTLVDVAPGSKSKRSTGLVLGIAGPVLVFVGMFGTLLVMVERNSALDCDASTGCSQDQPSYVPWVLSLVGGIAATTFGWVMFGTSGTKMKTSPYAPMSVALAPLVTPTTQGAALTVQF